MSTPVSGGGSSERSAATPLVASGCAGGFLSVAGLAQQAFVGQQLSAQARAAPDLEKRHGAAESGVTTTVRTSVSKIDIALVRLGCMVTRSLI